MIDDIEKMLKETFGESFDRLTKFQQDQVAKMTTKVQEMAREAVKEDLARLAQELADVKARVAMLEEERVENASERIEPTF